MFVNCQGQAQIFFVCGRRRVKSEELTVKSKKSTSRACRFFVFRGRNDNSLCAEGTLHRAQPCFIFHAPHGALH